MKTVRTGNSRCGRTAAITVLVTVLTCIAGSVGLVQSSAVSATTTVQRATFAQLSTGSTKDLQNTLLEIAYIGPANKPLPTVDLSGGVDPLSASDQLRSALYQFVSIGNPVVIVLAPDQMRAALEAASRFKGGNIASSTVGIFAIQLTNRRTAMIGLDQQTGRQALIALATAMPNDPARQAVQRLAQMIFP